MWSLWWTALRISLPPFTGCLKSQRVSAYQSFWFEPSNPRFILAIGKRSCAHSKPEDKDCLETGNRKRLPYVQEVWGLLSSYFEQTASGQNLYRICGS